MRALHRQRLAAKRRLGRSGLLQEVSALPRQTVATCDACGEPQPWIVSTEDRYGLALRLAVCPHCLLIAQVDRLTEEAARRFYRELYRPLVSTFHGTRIDSRAVFRESRSRAVELHSVLSLSTDGIAGGRWVDVGGGTGGSVLGLVERGIRPAETLIVDPAEEELAVARRNGFETLVGSAENGRGWTTGDFDLLLCLQTIDHLLHLGAAFRNFRKALRPGGLLALSVGDYRVAAASLDGSPAMDLQVDHTFYFTRATLEHAACRSGFRAERFGFTRPGYLVSLFRKPETEEAEIDGGPPLAESSVVEAIVRRALTPVCPQRPPTLRSRLYRLKRRWEKAFG